MRETKEHPRAPHSGALVSASLCALEMSSAVCAGHWDILDSLDCPEQTFKARFQSECPMECQRALEAGRRLGPEF